MRTDRVNSLIVLSSDAEAKRIPSGEYATERPSHPEDKLRIWSAAGAVSASNASTKNPHNLCRRTRGECVGRVAHPEINLGEDIPEGRVPILSK